MKVKTLLVSRFSNEQKEVVNEFENTFIEEDGTANVAFDEFWETMNQYSDSWQICESYPEDTDKATA